MQVYSRAGLTLVTFLIVYKSLFAQPIQSLSILDMEAEEIRVTPVDALLWKVDRQDLPRPTFIFAILHKVSKDDFFLPEGLTEYIHQCGRLMMEVNPMEYSMDHQHRGTMPLDSTLEVLLPKKQYQWVQSYMRDSLSDIAFYKLNSRYAPFLLARQALSDYCLGYKAGEEAVSYETILAQSIDLPIKVLGTEWTRTAWLDAYNFQEQTDYLIEALDQRAQLCATYQAIVRAYRRQNLDQIWLLSKDAPDLGDNTGKFIEARNQAWVDHLLWQMKIDNLFVAVNAVQLPGEFGLLHLLRKQGFEVSPIRLTIPEK